MRVRNGRGNIVVKFADGKSRHAPRGAVSFAYAFDGFSTNDDVLVIELNDAFDRILGMPWLARYQPEIDWLARSVHRRAGYDVSKVFTHLLVAPSRHVAVVDARSTTHPLQRESDGPRCVECAASVIGPVSNLPSRACEGMKRNADEQQLPHENNAVEQGLPHMENALPGISWKHFLRDLKAGEIEQVCLLTGSDKSAVLGKVVSDDASSSRPKAAEPKSVREARFAAQSWAALQYSNNPVYLLPREFQDIFPEKIPGELPAEQGVRHEIDLVAGAKYCVTRQWPPPRDQAQAIDEFFEGRRRAGHVRESISPHSSPIFCLKMATAVWRVVHAFNKLNDATIPAQTPIPRKDMVLDTNQAASSTVRSIWQTASIRS
ncbi:unnamed protein product [Phytophthora fragariaefolia]|uniref:Unnamed protein product n=1 Tax=Phytophthora fragariaefolia TaxID=1490495 RepID=A0A9W6WSD3_9STRA|nr:unnamed protein product [Phytophthora fragariaefolia]